MRPSIARLATSGHGRDDPLRDDELADQLHAAGERAERLRVVIAELRGERGLPAHGLQRLAQSAHRLGLPLLAKRVLLLRDDLGQRRVTGNTSIVVSEHPGAPALRRRFGDAEALEHR